MGRSSRQVIFAASAASAVLYFSKSSSFVPGPIRSSAAPVAAVTAASMLAPAAYADPIGDAAKKLAAESYDFAREVDWNNYVFLQAPGSFNPLAALKAIDKMMVMGAYIDPAILKQAAMAHHKAILSVNSDTGMTAKQDWENVNAWIGRMVAAVPESVVMDVYDSVKEITDSRVPEYMRSLVNADDADRAYKAFLEFKDVVKSQQVQKMPTVIGDANGAAEEFEGVIKAAKTLSDASYPFLKDIDWLSPIYLSPLPGVSPQQVLKAVDKTIVMGAGLDGNALAKATWAHHKAVGTIDAKGIPSKEAYTEVNADIGQMIATIKQEKVMDVFNAWLGVVSPLVPNKMFSMVDPLHANAAAKAFYDFKDAVKAAQAAKR